MTRRCSHCSNNGHNSRTCPMRGTHGGASASSSSSSSSSVKLFGVRLTDGSIKKSASMGNLPALYHSSSSAAASPNPDSPLSDHVRDSGHVPEGYLSDDPAHGTGSANRRGERKKGFHDWHSIKKEREEGRKMMTNGQKMTPSPEVAEQLQESKAVAAENGGRISGPQAGPLGRKADVLHVMLRLLCILSSVTALSFMVTAHQAGTVSIYGFTLPLYSKWSFSPSFEYLVGVSATVAAHSLLQLLLNMSRLLRKFPVVASRTHAWILFAGDQMFAYAMLSAGSAASGVTNLNRTGIHHTAMPNFCKPLSNFCGHVAVSIAFTFFSCFLLAASAIQEVLWLSKSKY